MPRLFCILLTLLEWTTLFANLENFFAMEVRRPDERDFNFLPLDCKREKESTIEEMRRCVSVRSLCLKSSKKLLVNMRVSVIERSLDKINGTVSCEATYTVGRSNFQCASTSSVSLELEPSFFDGGCALLFEISTIDAKKVPNIAWTIFPLVSTSNRIHRIQLSRPPTNWELSFKEWLLTGNRNLVLYPGYVEFSVERKIEETNFVHHTIPDLSGSSIHSERESPFKIFRYVLDPIKAVSCIEAKWHPFQTLLVINLGLDLFLFNALEDSFSGRTSLSSTAESIHWSVDRVICLLESGCVMAWDTTSGEIVEVAKPNVITKIISCHKPDRTCLFGETFFVVLEGEGEFQRFNDPRIVNVVSMFNVGPELYVVTNNHILKIWDGVNWGVSETDISTGPITLAFGRALVTTCADICLVESDLRIIRHLSHCKNITAISASNEYSMIAVGDSTGQVRIMDIQGNTIYSDQVFSSPVRGLSWSSHHHMLSIVGAADPGSWLPVVILIPSNDVRPYMSPTLYEWSSQWLNQESPVSDLVDVKEMKKEILKRSYRI